MPCQRCVALTTEYRIVSPDDLRNAIAIASDHIAAGILHQPSTPGGYVSSTPFQEVAAGAAWDDIVSYYFQCNACGQVFRLGAETYHGGGGSWQAVASLPENVL